MKINKICPFSLLALLIPFIVCNPNAHADPSGGGTAVVTVANLVHAAAAAASLSEDFGAVMDEYDKEVSEARKKELLDRAKNILTKLIEQANSVESEISILSKKKLDKVYSKKLDRVLSSVLRMREAAQKRMQAAVG
jgi:2C-methyl-D-erythritol 2,4-cyclodiphosphate synthase